jgi:hypothetical protein
MNTFNSGRSVWSGVACFVAFLFVTLQPLSAVEIRLLSWDNTLNDVWTEPAFGTEPLVVQEHAFTLLQAKTVGKSFTLYQQTTDAKGVLVKTILATTPLPEAERLIALIRKAPSGAPTPYVLLVFAYPLPETADILTFQVFNICRFPVDARIGGPDVTPRPIAPQKSETWSFPSTQNYVYTSIARQSANGQAKMAYMGNTPVTPGYRALFFITENTNPEIQDIIIVRRIDEAMPLEPKARPLTGVSG